MSDDPTTVVHSHSSPAGIVEDHRPQHWFWIDNLLIDEYLPAIGSHGLAIYALLARYANAKREAFPSLRRLQQQLHLSRHTLLKYLDLLEIHGLIKRTRRPSTYGDNESNLYILMEIPSIPIQRGGALVAPPGAKYAQSEFVPVVQPVHHLVQPLHPGGATSAPEVDLLNKTYKEREEELSSTILSGTGKLSPVPEEIKDTESHGMDSFDSHSRENQETPETLGPPEFPETPEPYYTDKANSTHSHSKPMPRPPHPKKTVASLEETDWLYIELLLYREDFDIEALNDKAWWANTGNSFPTFNISWIALAFASLARWLQDNPARRPRTPLGWKKRMNYSLNWYYDKHLRRMTHATRTP